jgi:hypothetical protein
MQQYIIENAVNKLAIKRSNLGYLAIKYLKDQQYILGNAAKFSRESSQRIWECSNQTRIILQ